MITAAEEEYLLERAYVPEHIVGLMTAISGGEPFLVDGYLLLAGENWLIVVGYPLEGNPAAVSLEAFARGAVSRFAKSHLLLIAPELPGALREQALEHESDAYYRLDAAAFEPKARLRREIERARDDLDIEGTDRFTAEHRRVIDEFLKREKPGPRIRELYLAMERYAGKSETSLILNARHRAREGRLTAFFVVETAAKRFVSYVVGCHSKRNYVPHASDLLMSEMVRLARESGKEYVHLGLGVNEGIRRFKEKWGGAPFLPYEYCEWRTGGADGASVLRMLETML
jgi:hypothetical protein